MIQITLHFNSIFRFNSFYIRSRDTELAHFLEFAIGSSSELEYQLLVSHDLELNKSGLAVKSPVDLLIKRSADS